MINVIKLERISEMYIRLSLLACRYLFIFLVTLLFGGAPSYAVTITEVSNSPIGCTTLVRGQINSGDAGRIRAALIRKGAQTLSSGPESQIIYEGRLCFDSPGGSFLEGVEIARVITKTSTGVDSGHTCESACFLAFMSGTVDRQEDRMIIPDRVMHPTATVGYHPPGLMLSESSAYSSEELTKAWTIALLSAAELVRLRYQQPEYVFRDELLDEMLRTPFSGMKYIETVKDALFNNIIVHPVMMPSLDTTDMAAFTHVCRAMGLMSEDFDLVYGPSSPNIYLGDFGEVIFEGIFDEGESGTTCSLIYQADAAKESWDRSAWMLGSMNASDWWIPPNDYSIAAFMHYPQSLKIRDLPTTPDHTGVYARMVSTLVSSIGLNNSTLSCYLAEGSAKIVNVNEYVNLRQQPGFSSRILSQIGKNEIVRVVRSDSIRATQICIDVCQALSLGTREQDTIGSRVQQCIDDNEVWIEVIDARGNRGWVSRKFLK